MSTSGTTTFNLNIGDVIEEAFEQSGLESKTGWDLKTGIRSLNLLALEWANRGVNFWMIDQQVLPLVQGTAQYTLPLDTIDVLDGAIRQGAGQTQQDIAIQRTGYDTYLLQTAKTQVGQPVTYTVLRGVASSTITFWPVPDQSVYSFLYYRMRRVQDAGSVGNVPDIPARFLPALTSGLAYYIAKKRPQVADRLPMLKAMYDEQFGYAIEEDRERAPLRIFPAYFGG